jgi:hypothetical protein
VPLHGRPGRSPGAGRKKQAPIFSYSVDITHAQAELLRLWGNGDISAGLRWLVDAAEIFVRPCR